MKDTSIDFTIKTLGKPLYFTQLKNTNLINDNERIVYDLSYNTLIHDSKEDKNKVITLEKAGPRENLYFDMTKVVAGIVTCGGLCPGLNNVIRSLVMQLHYQYNVNKIIGFKYGYRGIIVDNKISPMYLTIEDVQEIHNMGGSFLGSSRGHSDAVKIVDGLVYYGINMLFTIGGDGTIHGAMAIEEEIAKRKLDIVIVNIPKTIDNDIPFISKSFGFNTACAEAGEVIRCGHNEAKGAPNGIGIIKLMGRDSGFIAAQATLAQKDVNFVLIPEIDFDLDPPNGLLYHLEKKLEKNNHALIVVAEGAGQKFFTNEKEKQYDLSGNIILNDIGLFLKNKIQNYFDKKNSEVNVKYIDPSYIIRSIPAIADDAVYCGFLAEHAVHAAMSGKTRVVIGKWNDNFVYLPMDIVKIGRKKIDPKGSLWQSVLYSTGQHSLLNE